MKAKKKSSAGSIVKTTALWTAIGAVALGAGANIWAYERYSSGENASQARRVELNRDIETLNTTAVVFYVVAGAAAATWLTLILWPEDNAENWTITPAISPNSVGLGFVLTLDP